MYQHWREAVGRTAPFADVLVSITGVPAVRVLFLATAFVGAVGVMNSTLYSSAQMLYGLSRFALVSRAFSALHPKYGAGSPAEKRRARHCKRRRALHRSRALPF